MTRPPDVAFRERLTGSTPEPLKQLLFLDLRRFNERTSATSPYIADVVALLGTKIEAPSTWMPYVLDTWTESRYKVYSALCLRVNALESYCRGVRHKQAERSTQSIAERKNATQQRRKRRRRKGMGAPLGAPLGAPPPQPPAGAPPPMTSSDTAKGGEEAERRGVGGAQPPGLDRVDAFSHYAHMWLDAHLLMCTAIEQLGYIPEDGSDQLDAILEQYAPSAATVFHEGELPDLVARIESCSFFAETASSGSGSSSSSSKSRDSLTHMLSKAIPHRCVVRDVISIIESSYVENDAMMYLFTAFIAASMLGIYRHARQRPALGERLRIYRLLFFVPNTRVSRVINAARRARGITRSRAQDYRRDFVLPAVADDVEVCDYAQARAKKKLGVLPSSLPVEDVERRSRIYSFLASVSVNVKKTSKQRRFVHQNTVVNIVREYLVFVTARFIPHLYEELCARTAWLRWQQSVVDCMDTMRGSPTGVSCLKTIAAQALPSKTLYQVEKESFIEALVSACISFLDTGRTSPETSSRSAAAAAAAAVAFAPTSTTPEGSERALDAAFTPDVELILRRMLDCYPRRQVRTVKGRQRLVPLLPVTQIPGPDATDEDIQRNFIDRGHFPLLLLHANTSVVREYCAAYNNYQKTPSPGVAVALVCYLARNTTMYQLQLVHAFAQAQIDRERIYVFPLSKHLADKQASVLRERLNIDDTKPLPIHMLSSFVCRVCREFRGSLIDAKADASNELPMFGSELVSFTSSSVEMQVAERLRRRGFPTFAELQREGQRHKTLFAWYKANASIDGDMNIYPYNPSLFNAPPNAREDAIRWLAQLDGGAAPPHNPCSTDWNAADDDDDSLMLPVSHDNHEHVATGGCGGRVRPPLESPPFEESTVFEEFLVRWEKLNGRPFIVGHRSADPADECVVWTCAAKRYKSQERKTRQTHTAMQKVEDSITPQDRANALRSANTKRRHDMRCYYLYSLCSRQRMLSVSMLGYGLRIDSSIIVACCSCLGYTKMTAAHWYDATLLCTRCWRRTQQQGELTSLGVYGAGTSAKCRQCRSVRKPGERYFSTPVFDDATMRFVAVYLCAKHAKKKGWLFAAPNYHSLTTVDVGIKSKWGALRSWDATRNYARTLFGGILSGGSRLKSAENIDDDGAGGGEDDEENEVRETLRMATSIVGARALLDDADEDGDDDDADDIVMSASEAAAAAAKKTTKPKRAVKRRKIGADRRQKHSLVGGGGGA